MMKHDDADQNQPFVFKSTLGNFLHSIAYFYMCIALGSAIWWSDDNRSVVGFLLFSLIIHSLLAANSRLLFSIFAFLTFGGVMCQFLVFFYWMFTTTTFNGLPMGHFIVSIICIFFVFTVVIATQVFCSTAFLKLSLCTEHCQKGKSEKTKKRRRHVKKASTSSSSSEESEKLEKPKIPISNNSCSSHAPPTCSTTKFTTISSLDSSVKNT